MKIQSLSMIMICLLIAFMVAACEIKVMPPTNWGNKKSTGGDQVPLKAEVSLNKIAVGVVKDGWETIEVTATDKSGDPEKWDVKSKDETVAKAKGPENQIGHQLTVRGVNLGKTKLEITSLSGVKREVEVFVYSPMELDVGDLTISYVTKFEKRWNDSKSGGKYDGSFWHPVMPDPSWYALGSLGFKSYYDPNGKHWMMIVKKSNKDSDALKKPVSYEKEYEDLHSGAELNGSFWTPICESGYVAMGTVVVDHYGRGYPKKGELKGAEDVVCVRKDLTRPGEAGELIWNDQGTGADYYLGTWRITIPDIGVHDKAYLETGTFVGQGNFHKRYCQNDDCWEKPIDHPVMHVLSVDLPILIDKRVEMQAPKLKDYGQPSLIGGPEMMKSMLVPFSTLLEGKAFKRGDIGWLVENSPFVRVDRTMLNKLVFHTINRSSLVQENHLELVSGVSRTESETMSNTVGVSITAESSIGFLGTGGKASFTANYQFGYETTNSVTEMREKHFNVAINVPPGKAAACWQQRSRFRVIRHNKGELQSMAELDYGIDTYAIDEYPD